MPRCETCGLGKVTAKQADAIKVRVETLLACKLAGLSIDGDTARWLAQTPSTLRDKLANAGLIDRETIDRVIAVLPDEDWRCMIALARYGGPRCRSEPQALRKCDIDWTGKKIRVTVPKMSHLPNKATRIIPLFPELVERLKAACAAHDGEFVMGRYRGHSNNFGTKFNRFVVAAGLKPWPKPFTNLRSSRETELAEEHPIHVVCAWIGNSPDVAVRHYLQLRPEHFDKATGEAAARQAAQNTSERTGIDLNRTEAEFTPPRILQSDSTQRGFVRADARVINGPGPT